MSHGVTAVAPGQLPLVVQLGFAGSRRLLDEVAHPSVSGAAFDVAIQAYVQQRLQRLPADLGLTPSHFFCALSQGAIGADTAFGHACAALDIRQRILLSQPLDDALSARSTDGVADYTAAQQATARALLASPHVIETRVVSTANDRSTRFEEVNLEIVRASDVLLCVVRDGAVAKAGGSLDLLARGAARGLPVLEIRVSCDADGHPVFVEQWRGIEAFMAPSVPNELSDVHLADVARLSETTFTQPLLRFASAQARHRQGFFRRTALIIVLTHVFATLLSLIALKLGTAYARVVIADLTLELALLLTGFFVHRSLHHSRATRVWAMSRLVAETARSVVAAKHIPGTLSHLSTLTMPTDLRALLNTLNVVHLEGARNLDHAQWHARRDAYVSERLQKTRTGQISYYGQQLVKARRQLSHAQTWFRVGSLGAIVATMAKLLAHVVNVPGLESAVPILGPLAIFLPVVAVGALSLAASFDLEARVHTYTEMLAFLARQATYLSAATSEHEFAALVVDTERVLLGETAVWYSRRAFTSVA